MFFWFYFDKKLSLCAYYFALCDIRSKNLWFASLFLCSKKRLQMQPFFRFVTIKGLNSLLKDILIQGCAKEWRANTH